MDVELTSQLSAEIYALAIESDALASEQRRAEARLATVLARKQEVHLRLNFLRELESQLERIK